MNASYRKDGLDWFPVDPKFRVEAKFTPHTEEKKVEMLNIRSRSSRAAGYVDFELQAQKVHMEPMKARGICLPWTKAAAPGCIIAVPVPDKTFEAPCPEQRLEFVWGKEALLIALEDHPPIERLMARSLCRANPA